MNPSRRWLIGVWTCWTRYGILWELLMEELLIVLRKLGDNSCRKNHNQPMDCMAIWWQSRFSARPKNKIYLKKVVCDCDILKLCASKYYFRWKFSTDFPATHGKFLANSVSNNFFVVKKSMRLEVWKISARGLSAWNFGFNFRTVFRKWQQKLHSNRSLW